MSWFKGLFSGKSDGSQSLVPLTDREYLQLFLQVLQGVAANWDEQRLLKLLGDRCGDRQMVVWLRGYGDRLLSEPANPDLAGLLVRLGEIGCGELGVVAQGIGLEMGNIPVEQVVSEVEPREVNEGQNSEAEILVQKGLAEIEASNYQESLEYFNRAIALNPSNFVGWNGKAIALQKLNRFDEAVFSKQIATSLSDKNKELGKNSQLVTGQSKQTINYFSINCNRLWIKGVSLNDLGRYEEAIVLFDRVISINPNEHEAWCNKGKSLHELKRYEKALLSYNHATLTKPNCPEAWNGRGNCLFELRKYEEAIASYDRALSITQGNHWRSWLGRGNAAYNVKEPRLIIFVPSLPQNMQNTKLDQCEYKGGLASYNEGLKYINQSTEPEGWGQLHRAIGNAHYLHGRTTNKPRSIWKNEAIPSYETSLKSLTATPQFESAHLETLQDLIRVLLALRETEKAAGLLRKGTDFLEARLKEKSERSKERFEKQFRPYFNELTVGLYIQQGKLTEALEIAEKDKNAFLRDGLLADITEPSPDYSQMCAFLNQKPNTAIIYWHLSDNALTTFILAPKASSEITLNLLPTPTTENATLTQRNQLTNWMSAWQNDYAKYGGKKTKSESQETKPEAKGENHPWRVQMEERLATLKNILRITDIEIALADSSHCTQLLLIPHRDLHLYPLDSLFDSKYTIAYLPSIQVGIKLLNQPKPNYKRLLSVENPDSSITLEDGTKQNFDELFAAEAESEMICRMYAEPTRRANAETILTEVKSQLINTDPQPHTIFHFTGHGYYDFFNPSRSALFLSDNERLILEEIRSLDLCSYQLACLSACETAIAGNQTITKEYVGLTSAFLCSGVANVVSTLWKIPDSMSSALLMIEFHRYYLAGVPEAAALAAAKHWLRNATREDLTNWCEREINNLSSDDILIEWLRCYCIGEISASIEVHPFSHPYYWSAFTITGL